MRVNRTDPSCRPDKEMKTPAVAIACLAKDSADCSSARLTPMVQGVVVAGTRFRNVPTTVGNDWPLRTPGNARTEQFFFTR
jgi:peptide/nickel transport system substrate-binding protein